MVLHVLQLLNTSTGTSAMHKWWIHPGEQVVWLLTKAFFFNPDQSKIEKKSHFSERSVNYFRRNTIPEIPKIIGSPYLGDVHPGFFLLCRKYTNPRHDKTFNSRTFWL